MCGNTSWVFLYHVGHRIDSYLSQNDFTSITIYWDIVPVKKGADKKEAACYNKILSFLITFTVPQSMLKLIIFLLLFDGGIWHTKLCNRSLDGVTECFAKISLSPVNKLL